MGLERQGGERRPTRGDEGDDPAGLTRAEEVDRVEREARVRLHGGCVVKQKQRSERDGVRRQRKQAASAGAPDARFSRTLRPPRTGVTGRPPSGPGRASCGLVHYCTRVGPRARKPPRLARASKRAEGRVRARKGRRRSAASRGAAPAGTGLEFGSSASLSAAELAQGGSAGDSILFECKSGFTCCSVELERRDVCCRRGDRFAWIGLRAGSEAVVRRERAWARLPRRESLPLAFPSSRRRVILVMKRCSSRVPRRRSFRNRGVQDTRNHAFTEARVARRRKRLESKVHTLERLATLELARSLARPVPLPA